jgi:hypothetical protein
MEVILTTDKLMETILNLFVFAGITIVYFTGCMFVYNHFKLYKQEHFVKALILFLITGWLWKATLEYIRPPLYEDEYEYSDPLRYTRWGE